MNNVKISQYFLSLLLVFGMLSGCTVKYVAEYDSYIKEEIVQIAKKVDLFWGKLIDTPIEDRKYDAFKDQYNEIETDIRGLLIRNQIRTLNKLSTKQVSNLLDLWMEDKKNHKKSNTFTDFEAKRHRKQFVRVFIAIAKGEEAKNM
jgi:hypothetical protein